MPPQVNSRSSGCGPTAKTSKRSPVAWSADIAQTLLPFRGTDFKSVLPYTLTTGAPAFPKLLRNLLNLPNESTFGPTAVMGAVFPNLPKDPTQEGRLYCYPVRAVKGAGRRRLDPELRGNWQNTKLVSAWPVHRKTRSGEGMKSFTLVTLTLAAALSGGIALERRPLQAGGADDGPALSPQPSNLPSAGPAQSLDPTPAWDATDARVRPNANTDNSTGSAIPPAPVWPAEKSKPVPLSAAGPACAKQPESPTAYLPQPQIPDLPAAAAQPKSEASPAASSNSASAGGKGEVKSVSGVLGDILPLPVGPIESVDPPTSAPVRMVNDRRFSINYEVKDVGPSGVSQIEFWYTSDGNNWQKAGNIHEAHSPYSVNVDRDGRYGVTMIARSGVGLGKRPRGLARRRKHGLRSIRPNRSST